MRSALLAKALYLRLVRPLDQSPAVGRRIINKLPFVIFFLVIELTDARIFLVGAGHSHDWTATESYARQFVLRGARAIGVASARVRWSS